MLISYILTAYNVKSKDSKQIARTLMRSPHFTNYGIVQKREKNEQKFINNNYNMFAYYKTIKIIVAKI